MKTVWLDGRLFEDLRSVYEYLDAMMGFPDHFGYNLDALHDYLTEIGEKTEIIVTYVNDLLSMKKGGVLLRVLDDSADENPFLRVLKIY